MTDRRRLPWLLALPLMLGGSFAAHVLGSGVFGRPAVVPLDADASEAVARVDHGYATGLPVIAGLAIALGAVVLFQRLVRQLRRGRGVGASPVSFFLLPPIAYTIQELGERLVRAEGFPFNPIHEPWFIGALALQVPFGVVAFLVARAFLGLGRTISRALSSKKARLPTAHAAPRSHGSAGLLPQRSVFAPGPSQRAPPALAAP